MTTEKEKKLSVKQHSDWKEEIGYYIQIQMNGKDSPWSLETLNWADYYCLTQQKTNKQAIQLSTESALRGETKKKQTKQQQFIKQVNNNLGHSNTGDCLKK